MIYIEKYERIALPRKFRGINNVCAHIYDQLTEFLSEPHYEKLTRLDIDVDLSKMKLIEELERGEVHMLDWLAKNELDDELADFLTRHITFSVLSDFLNFVYESFSCAKRGKMSVAYALLRKPFTDELLIFEQLLYDRKDFIRRFYHDGNPASYDPAARTVDKKDIIHNAVNKVQHGAILNGDLIYDFRYNKTFGAGLNGYSNHALHIVTTDKNYQTAQQNLNFVFTGARDYERYCEHYYYLVPYLLLYTVAVVDELLFQFLPGEDFSNLKNMKAFRRFAASLAYTEHTKSASRRSNNQLMKTLAEVLCFTCPNCQGESKMERHDYELFIETELILCKHCRDSLLRSKESIQPILKLMTMMKNKSHG